MIVLRVVSGLMLTSGLLLGIFGFIVLSSLDRDMKLMNEMQRQGVAQGIDIPTFRSILVQNAVGYVVIGILSSISGIGMLFRQNWARLVSTGIFIFLLSLSAYQLARSQWYGGIDPSRIGYSLLIALPAGAFIYYFLRRKTRLLFTDSTVAV